MLRILFAYCLLCLVGIGPAALADDAVDARLHIVIPAGPGGGLDATARAIGRALVSEQEVARVSYENRSGGGGGNIETLQKAVRDVHPMRTYGTPEDIANLVNWLASDEARYASGQLWVLDGGLSAQVQQMKL